MNKKSLKLKTINLFFFLTIFIFFSIIIIFFLFKEYRSVSYEIQNNEIVELNRIVNEKNMDKDINRRVLSLTGKIHDLFQIQKNIQISILSISILTVFILSLYILLFYKGIFKNISSLKEKIHDINIGNSGVSNHIILNSNDEVEEVALEFNNFEDKLEELIMKIKNGAFSIQQTVEILNTYNDSLLRKSKDQHLRVESINDNIIDMRKIIGMNNENTLKLNRIVKKTKNVTEIITVEANNLNKTITSIFDGSEKIEKISESIEELSFQTTILSLNSAVESTRIQSRVKSFEVISNEIHRLSTIGKQAAKEIKNLTSENKVRVDESSFYLTNTVNLINMITTMINEISSLLEELYQSSKFETEGISSILSSISEIELLTQQSNVVAKDTLDLSEQLNNQALNFLEIISYFDKTVNKKEGNENSDNKYILTEEEKLEIINSFEKNREIN